jgi:ABC-2 type transport system permease protein
MITAILRAQLLSMRLRGDSRASGALFSAFTGLLYYGFWSFFAFGAAMLFSIQSGEEKTVAMLSIALLVATLYWQLAPLLTASFGASLDLRKLLVYPIPPSRLFVIEVLLRLTTCIEILLILAGISIGLMQNPQFGLKAAPFILSGALLFAATNVLVSAGTRQLVERFFRSSRWKEVGFLLFLAMTIAPQVFVRSHVPTQLLVRFAPSQIFWPWASVARIMAGDRAAIAAPVAIVWLAAAWWFSRGQFFRSLRFDADERRQPGLDARPAGAMERIFRLPSRFLPDPLAALVEKEMRTLSRIPRVRVVFAMSCFFGLVLFLPSIMGKRPASSRFVENALPIMAVYGLLMLSQLTFWNCFGFDRSALMGYFCWPIRLRDVFVAKNLTVALVLLPQIVIVWGMTAVIRLPASPGKFLEAVIVMIAAALYWFGLGNIASVRLPRAMNPEKMNQMSGKMQALTIWVAPLLLLPIVLAYVARAVFHSQLIFAAVMCVALILGAIFYHVCLDSAVEAARTRRETMLQTLSHSEGPISIS